MALLQPQQIGLGTAVTPVAATATVGDAAYPDDRAWFEVTNGSGGAVNATLVVPGSYFGVALPDVVVSIPAGQTRRFGPLVSALADQTDGQIDLICASVTSVTIAVVRI